MKTCTVCKETKALDLFPTRKSGNGETYHRGQCRDCYNRSRRENKDYSMRHWLTNIKSRAKDKGLEFDLDLEWLYDNLPKKCPVYKFKLEFGSKDWNNSPSCDRIVNEVGYLKSNCVVVSQRANCLKSDSSLDDLERLVKFYRKSFKQVEENC